MNKLVIKSTSIFHSIKAGRKAGTVTRPLILPPSSLVTPSVRRRPHQTSPSVSRDPTPGSIPVILFCACLMIRMELSKKGGSDWDLTEGRRREQRQGGRQKVRKSHEERDRMGALLKFTVGGGCLNWEPCIQKKVGRGETGGRWKTARQGETALCIHLVPLPSSVGRRAK